MNLFIGKKVGVSLEEKSLPYYKFFERDMAKIPEEKIKFLETPSELEIVPFEDKNLFLTGEDKNFCQIGYGVASNGSGFVCNETYMPNVEVEMLEWWFAWHSVGSDLRYKIWDSEDHYFARADNAEYEDVGNGPDFLKLCFERPKDFGYDEKLVGTEKCESLVCAIGDGNCAAAMTHKFYKVANGTMLSSRFWIGYGIVDGKIIKTLPDGVKVPVEVPRGLFAHNIKEFTNLAAILPEVYEENKNNF